MGFIAHHEKEYGLGGDRVWMVIVDEFHMVIDSIHEVELFPQKILR